jgi:hypothetical protein
MAHKTATVHGRHLIFATQKQLQLLKKARRWYIDGTFFITPKPFYQVYVIHAFIRHGELEQQVQK